MLRLVLFDIDGTLIHTDGAGVKAFGKAFEMQFKIRERHGRDEICRAGPTPAWRGNFF